MWHIMRADEELSRMFVFSMVLLVIAVGELATSAYSGNLSIGLSGFRSAFDGFAIFISMVSFLVSKWKSSVSFSYGLERVEVLAVFTNSVFVIFVCVYVLLEAFERYLEDHSFTTSHTMAVSSLSFLAHLYGVLYFQEQMQMRSESVVTQSKSWLREMWSLAIDLFPAASTFLGCVVYDSMEIPSVDPFLCFLNVIILFLNAYPHVLACINVLLLGVPKSIQHIVEQNLKDASSIEGVIDIQRSHFWTCSPGVYVGSLNIRIRPDSNEQSILRQIRAIYAPYIKHLTIQLQKWNPNN
uniref:Cation efflux protein transmembrane domain-containing protein n=1 Tax=Arcella intermedia TaxID=1963864 RepID=A0A6B2LAZ5_9EUKA